MKKNKISLVLEGGGMRGAYTAGALCWLIDNKIEFDCAYGISTGAMHLCNYLLKDTDKLKKFSTEYITDKNAIGVRSFFRCRRIVDYDYLFNEMLIKKGFEVSKLNKLKTIGKVGVYNLDKEITEYISTKNITINQLKAACSLPVIGKVVCEDNAHLFDGGITEMIPIKQAIKDKCTKHLIITTKPIDYVRKPSSKFVVFVMRMLYPKWPCVSRDYKVRHINYYSQIDIIKDLQAKGNALYCYPSKTSNVTRLGGSQKDLVELFNLGYNDMESRKKELFKLVKNV